MLFSLMDFIEKFVFLENACLMQVSEIEEKLEAQSNTSLKNMFLILHYKINSKLQLANELPIKLVPIKPETLGKLQNLRKLIHTQYEKKQLEAQSKIKIQTKNKEIEPLSRFNQLGAQTEFGLEKWLIRFENLAAEKQNEILAEAILDDLNFLKKFFEKKFQAAFDLIELAQAANCEKNLIMDESNLAAVEYDRMQMIIPVIKKLILNKDIEKLKSNFALDYFDNSDMFDIGYSVFGMRLTAHLIQLERNKHGKHFECPVLESIPEFNLFKNNLFKKENFPSFNPRQVLVIIRGKENHWSTVSFKLYPNKKVYCFVIDSISNDVKYGQLRENIQNDDRIDRWNITKENDDLKGLQRSALGCAICSTHFAEELSTFDIFPFLEKMVGAKSGFISLHNLPPNLFCNTEYLPFIEYYKNKHPKWCELKICNGQTLEAYVKNNTGKSDIMTKNGLINTDVNQGIFNKFKRVYIPQALAYIEKTSPEILFQIIYPEYEILPANEIVYYMPMEPLNLPILDSEDSSDDEEIKSESSESELEAQNRLTF